MGEVGGGDDDDDDDNDDDDDDHDHNDTLLNKDEDVSTARLLKIKIIF